MRYICIATSFKNNRYYEIESFDNNQETCNVNCLFETHFEPF